MEAQWVCDFKENTRYRIDENTRMIQMACKKINDQQVWQRPNGSSNSLGNQVLHLCGNMTQYVISSLGEQEDARDRDAEFEATDGYTKALLLEKLLGTVNDVKKAIQEATEGQLLRKRHVQGFHFSGMGCVIHAVEHYSYHTGQIAFWIKQLIDEELGFYGGLDLNTKNND